MQNSFTKITDLASAHYLRELHPGDYAIDATVGNGHDTCALARRVGSRGHVWGFDIQVAAIEKTAERLSQEGLTDAVTLINKSHAEMMSWLPPGTENSIKSITFNLGYLPGGDKSVTTIPQSTILALNQALPLLSPEGTLTVAYYTGHPGGIEEKCALEEWLKHNQAQLIFDHFTALHSHRPERAPGLYVIRKAPF